MAKARTACAHAVSNAQTRAGSGSATADPDLGAWRRHLRARPCRHQRDSLTFPQVTRSSPPACAQIDQYSGSSPDNQVVARGTSAQSTEWRSAAFPKQRHESCFCCFLPVFFPFGAPFSVARVLPPHPGPWIFPPAPFVSGTRNLFQEAHATRIAPQPSLPPTPSSSVSSLSLRVEVDGRWSSKTAPERPSGSVMRLLVIGGPVFF